jgi:hypothetical protein
MGSLEMLTSKKFGPACRNLPSETCAVDNKKPKTKKCAICKEAFVVFRSMQKVCGKLECAKAAGELKTLKDRAKREQEERKKTRVRREALKKHSEWEADLQKLVNKYVRMRDADLPCISCGTTVTVQWEAGHYISRGANNTLRFDLRNIHKQCHRCNVQLSSNAVMYRIGLVKKIGLETVEWLEGPHPAKKMSIPELKEQIAHYKGLLKLADKEVA